jgi:hypothetical protein
MLHRQIDVRDTDSVAAEDLAEVERDALPAE